MVNALCRCSEMLLYAFPWRYFPKISILKKIKTARTRGNYKDISQYLSCGASIIENIHHTLTPCPLSSYSLDGLGTKTAKVHSHLKKPVLSSNYLLQLTHIISRRVGSSDIKVASFLADSQHLMRTLLKLLHTLRNLKVSTCVSTSEP